MKLFKNLIVVCFFGLFSSLVLANPMSIFHKALGIAEPEVPNSAINTLTKCDLAKRYVNITDRGGEVTQLVLHFSNPLYYEKECDEKSSTITLYFPGMQQNDFETLKFIDKCKQLAHIKQVTVKTESKPVSRVVVQLSFAPGQAVVRLSKIDQPHCLFIDCYPRETLQKISTVNDILQTAHASMPQKVLPS